MKVVFLFITAYFLLSPFKSAQASFFSDIFGLTASANTAAVANTSNSQNVDILEAAVSPTHDFTKTTTGDLAVKDGALMSEVGPLGTAADVKTEYVSDQISTYVVRSGDTLAGIAKMFDVTPGTITFANEIKKGQALTVGTVLTILPISGVEYKISKGDTLKGIAKKFGADIDEVSTYNGVTEDTILAIGDILMIPDGETIEESVSSAKPTGSVKPKAPTYSGPSYAGYYMRPISGGRRTQGIHGHNGVDLSTGIIGTPIMAAASGTIIISKNSGYNGGYGSYIVISHPNGTQTLYAHLSATKVSVGAHVDQGQVIGLLGNTGKSTGPHLHFEVRGAKNPF